MNWHPSPDGCSWSDLGLHRAPHVLWLHLEAIGKTLRVSWVLKLWVFIRADPSESVTTGCRIWTEMSCTYLQKTSASSRILQQNDSWVGSIIAKLELRLYKNCSFSTFLNVQWTRNSITTPLGLTEGLFALNASLPLWWRHESGRPRFVTGGYQGYKPKGSQRIRGIKIDKPWETCVFSADDPRLKNHQNPFGSRLCLIP